MRTPTCLRAARRARCVPSPRPALWGCAALLCGLAGSIILCAPAALAQLPQARLYTLFPPGNAAGSTNTVHITGADLDEPVELRFSHPGISGAPKLAEATGQPVPNTFVVAIGADVPTGVYEARFCGRFVVSNPRAFAVSHLKEVGGDAPNHAAANAMEVAVGTVVNARAVANANSYFRFPVKQGQRLWVQASARTLDSRMDPVLALRDEAGRELAVARQGGLLEFSATKDSRCLLEVHDLLYRGGEEYSYRLALSTGPRLEFVLPPMGTPGTRWKFILLGRNLPGSTQAAAPEPGVPSLERLEVSIDVPAQAPPERLAPPLEPLPPAAAVLDGFTYRLVTPEGESNPVFIGFARAPVVFDDAAGSKPAEARELSPPCEVAGRWSSASPRHYFTFEAKQGTVYWIEVISHRLGEPSSPFLLVQRVSRSDKGEEQLADVLEAAGADKNLGGPEFITSARDPVTRFEAPADGRYRLQVRDLFPPPQGARPHQYRLAVRMALPDFRLVALPVPPPPANKEAKVASVWSALVRRGETIPIKVLAFRQDGFDGEITLSCSELPPGVTCSETRIPNGQNSALLLLTASEQAAQSSGPLRVVGRAKAGDAMREHEARAGGVVWNVPDYNIEAVRARLARDSFLGVCGVESAPLTIRPGEAKVWEVAAGEKLRVPLEIIRRADFNGALSLKAAGASGLDGVKELEVPAGATNALLELDLAQAKLAPGAHTLHLSTQTAGKYRNNPEGAQAAEAAAKAAERDLAEQQAAQQQATAKLPTAKTAAAAAAEVATRATESLAAARRSAGEAAEAARAARAGVEAAKAALDSATAAKEKATPSPENGGEPSGATSSNRTPAELEEAVRKATAAHAAAAAAAAAKTSAGQAAVEAEMAAAKVASETGAKAKAAADELAAAERVLAESPARIKEAEARKAATAEKAKQAAEKAKPQDLTITVHSAPITVKVIEATRK